MKPEPYVRGKSRIVVEDSIVFVEPEGEICYGDTITTCTTVTVVFDDNSKIGLHINPMPLYLRENLSNSTTTPEPIITYENIWDKINPSLAGTWWETDFFPGLPWKVYRTRIMVMEGRRCYSIHTDDNPRLHIAITTNPQARFIFTSPPEITHIPSDGYVWWVDTRNEHTAINGSMDTRVHLMMSLVNTTQD